MAWRIETDLQPDYLTVRIIGNADDRVAGEIVAGVFREITASDRSNLLVDIREVERRPSILETFNLVSRYPPMRGIRVAIVDRPENSEWSEFYETVSMNRGCCNRVFIGVEKAMEWLGS